MLGNDTAAVDTTMTPGTMGARQRAMQRISGIIGPEKTYHLARLVRTRWEGTAPEGITAGTTPNTVPTDTRVVINAPSFRMDLFENGQLVKSWPISSGYPEFPLPAGMRQASEIIFNPSWTPPDEPWVEAPGSKVKVGEKVDPGSKLNPLGIMKIPIGGPSLIHGGKSQGQLGTFGSHGCAGLTNDQAREFARLLAEVSGAQLTDKQIAEYGRNKTESQTVKLATPVPVELRYETMVVQDGAIHLYPDVYDRGTNTEQNLRAVLQAHGVTLEQLTEQERTKLMSALEQMGGTGMAAGDSAKASTTATRTDTASNNSTAAAGKQKVKVTRSIKGPKELIVPIAALKGKGYPKQVKTATRKPAAPKQDTTA
jgi:lipoprotein-anchoring transpeptidase ErfK/SrfK